MHRRQNQGYGGLVPINIHKAGGSYTCRFKIMEDQSISNQYTYLKTVNHEVTEP